MDSPKVAARISQLRARSFSENIGSIRYIALMPCPAGLAKDCFQISKRGYIREGYWADLVLVDLATDTTVSKDNIYYQCGWSPLEGKTFNSSITHTIVSGHLAFESGIFDESVVGKRILFER